jgi:hypothetical protein
VLILLHEREARSGPPSHRAHALAARWQEAGLAVRFAYGVDDAGPADVILPHVDLTHRPAEVQAWLDEQPVVLNRQAHDTSKRRVSRHLVAREDAWEGPVIVKTDLNFGGHPELRLLGRHGLFGRWARRRPRRLARARWWPSEAYPVFAHRREVPAAIWRSRRWVVERFLPERQGDDVALRTWTFLGSAGACVRRTGPGPLLKPRHGDATEPVDVPPRVAALRRELGLDYGKIDFVLHEGEVVVLDANATPGLRPGPEVLERRALDVALARALGPWLPRGPSARLEEVLEPLADLRLEGLGT